MRFLSEGLSSSGNGRGEVLNLVSTASMSTSTAPLATVQITFAGSEVSGSSHFFSISVPNRLAIFYLF